MASVRRDRVRHGSTAARAALNDWICAICDSVRNADETSACGGVDGEFTFLGAWF